MGFGLIHAQALHKPAVLLWSEGSGFAFFPGPLERTGLQPLVQQNKSITFPVQRLDSIPAPATKQEQCIGEWIQIELLLDKRSQPIYPTAQVGVAAGDEYPLSTVEVCQHDFNTRITASTVAVSAPL